MDSRPGKHRRRLSQHRRSSQHRRPSGAPSSRSRSRSKKSAPSQSFAPPPSPSSRTISFSAPKGRPVFKAFLAAFIGVFVLILLGGSHHTVALGMALLLPGIALAMKPPTTGLGKLGAFGVGGLLLCLLLAFVPQFYWPSGEWRLEAVESFGIDLPAVLSVQPWISFEAWLMAVAGFAWLYAALQWPVNYNGRCWLFFYVSILLAVLAGIVVWGNLVGARYPGAEGATAFSFFPNRNQTANFLALGGVATFAYAMEGVRSRTLMPLIGVPVSALCMVGLVLGVSRAGILLYFLGVALWFICSLRAHSLSRFFKIGFPVVVVALSIVASSNERTVERILSFFSQESQLEDEFRVRIYEDTLQMVLDAPLTGIGVGSFPAVFPQYREASANYQRVVHPESDLFWLASEGGLLAVGFVSLFLVAYARRCRGFGKGASAGFRLTALVAVLIFLLHALVDVPAHRPGTVYFAILFAALALPSRERPESWLPPVVWRVLGAVLIAFGLLWIAGGAFNLPRHSSDRADQGEADIRSYISVGDYDRAIANVDDLLELRPLDWRNYFQRAQLTLSDTGNRASAAADFRRARFVEPILGVVTYEEGKVWRSYDLARSVSAWRETLFREMENMDGIYNRMLGSAWKSSDALERMARMSELDPHYRAFFLCWLRGDKLMSEIRYELSKDPGLTSFNQEQRTKILHNWVKRGDAESAEAFVIEYGDSLERIWWLLSLIRKDQADIKAAVELIRTNVEVPGVPEVPIDEALLVRLRREYAVAPKDIMKGTALFNFYLKRQDYEKALPILDRLLEAHKPPLYLYYWRAECLFQVEEYVESWYNFEEYLEKLWQSH